MPRVLSRVVVVPAIVLSLAAPGHFAFRSYAANAAAEAKHSLTADYYLGQTTGAHAQAETLDSESCQRARNRANEILAVLDAKASPAVKAFASSVLAKAGSASPDVVWDEFAGMAYLRGNPDTALWAEVHALALNWRAEYVAHAGVYLLNLKNVDDAKLFLHCAYDLGWRSVSLFEALAQAYDASKEKDKAKQNIDQAEELNPEDLILQAEASLIASGTLPPIPPRKKDDLDLLLDDLERHFRDVNSRVRDRIHLVEQIDQIAGSKDSVSLLRQQTSWESDMRKRIDRIRQDYLPLARISLEDFRKTRFPQGSTRLHETFVTYFKDLVIEECVFQYVYITTQEVATYANYPSQGAWNADFWAHAMHTDVVSYVQQGQANKATFVEPGGGSSFSCVLCVEPGFSGAAHYQKALREANQVLQHSSGGRDAVVTWCAHMIPAYQGWQTSAKSEFQNAAEGFSAPAKQLLAWGGAEAADARSFLIRAMRVYKPINYTPMGDKTEDNVGKAYSGQANSFPQLINQTYRGLIKQVAGNPESPLIPKSLTDNQKAFAREEGMMEQELHSTAQSLIRECSPVATEVLKRLNGSDADATREELFNDLVESLNAKLEPTTKCEFELGDFASAHIEFDWEKSEIHTEVEASWDFKKGERGGGEWKLAGGTTTKFDSHGNPIESEVTVAGDAQLDIGRGYVEVGIVAERDPATDTWKREAEVKGAIGLGVEEKHFGGFACYPGEVTMKFDPREVMQKAVRYLEASK